MTSPSSPLFRLDQRAVLRVGGAEARPFLDRLLTRDVANLADGEATYAGLLTPQGKIIAELFVFADGPDALLIDAPATIAEGLTKRLKLYRLRAAVELDDVSDEWAVLQSFDGSLPLPGRSAPDPRGQGTRAIAPASDAPATDNAGYHGARLALGLPEQGADYGGEELFPADVNLDLLNGVDFAKGCFIGQEVVSRMKRRGSVRKRTLMARFDGDAPEAGTSITIGDSTIGTLMSSAGGRALALVRLDRLEAAGGVDAPASANGQICQLAFPDWFPAEARTHGDDA